MKKNLLWMFAAILLCGLTITMFTACGGDDEDTRPNSEQQGGDEGDDPAIPEATAYDITFTVVAPTNAFDITSYDFTYADSKGNKITKEIDADMPNEPLSELEKNGLDMYIKTSSMTNSNFAELLSDTRAQHFTLTNIPAGSKVQYQLVMHPSPEYKPAEGTTISFATPAVNVTQTPQNGKKTITSSFENKVYTFKDTKWEYFKTRMEGHVLIDREITVGLPRE